MAVIIAKKKGYKGTPGKFDWKNLFTATMRAIPALSLIIVVIGGIIAGVFTATEGSAIAVVYALIDVYKRQADSQMEQRAEETEIPEGEV